MRIRQSIPKLHPGQVAILVLVGVMTVVLLLPVRRHAAEAKRWYGEAASQSQQELDSLNDLSGPPRHHDYPDNPLARKMAASLDSNRQARRLALGSDTIRLDRQRLKLELRSEDMVAQRDWAAVQLVSLDLAIAAVVGASLWVVWVWLGGRQEAKGERP